MNFLADEGVDRQIVEWLRQDGHLVWYVAEMEPGISDAAMLDLANLKTALLLTTDKDFGQYPSYDELVLRQHRLGPGIVLIQLAGLSPPKKADVVVSAINKHRAELTQAFTVITPISIRTRRWA